MMTIVRYSRKYLIDIYDACCEYAYILCIMYIMYHEILSIYTKMYMYTNYVITSYLNNACIFNSCITQTGLHGNAWLVAMQSCLGHATILSSKLQHFIIMVL